MSLGSNIAMVMATLLTGASVAPYAAPAKETRTMLSQDDLMAIKAMVPAMEAAWRTHDAAAYAGQFVPDAEHVNDYGMWWRGRGEVEQGIAFAFNTAYPDNPIMASDASVSAVGANVAIL